MNGYEQTARAAKARKMADALMAVGIPERNARLMTRQEWESVAKCAGCRPPRSEATKQAVYDAMADHSAPCRISVREWRNRVEEACSQNS